MDTRTTDPPAILKGTHRHYNEIRIAHIGGLSIPFPVDPIATYLPCDSIPASQVQMFQAAETACAKQFLLLLL